MPKGEGQKRECTVCTHPAIDEINERLISGGSIRATADEFGLNRGAIWKHKSNHIPKLMIQAKALQDENRADMLLDQLERIYGKAWDLVEKADSDKKYQAAATCLKEARSCLELLARLMGELKTGHTINVYQNPEFVQVRTNIVQALEQYPEARRAVVQALEGEVIDADYCESD